MKMSLFLTDEKLFTMMPLWTCKVVKYTVRASYSQKHNIRASRLRTRPTYRKSLILTVAVSKLGCTNLIFVYHGAEINGQFYRDVLLMQEPLPAISNIAGDVFIFQHDNARAYRARNTLWPDVRLSVCHKSASYRNGWRHRDVFTSAASSEKSVMFRSGADWLSVRPSVPSFF